MHLGSWFFVMLSSTTYSLAYISAITSNLCPSTGFSSWDEEYLGKKFLVNIKQGTNLAAIHLMLKIG
jgi:hypothetical protein